MLLSLVLAVLLAMACAASAGKNFIFFSPTRCAPSLSGATGTQTQTPNFDAFVKWAPARPGYELHCMP